MPVQSEKPAVGPAAPDARDECVGGCLGRGEERAPGYVAVGGSVRCRRGREGFRGEGRDGGCVEDYGFDGGLHGVWMDLIGISECKARGLTSFEPRAVIEDRARQPARQSLQAPCSVPGI